MRPRDPQRVDGNRAAGRQNEMLTSAPWNPPLFHPLLASGKVTALREGISRNTASRRTTAKPSRPCSAPCSSTTRPFTGVAEFLLAEHFADGVHGRIFAAIAKLWSAARSPTR